MPIAPKPALVRINLVLICVKERLLAKEIIFLIISYIDAIENLSDAI